MKMRQKVGSIVLANRFKKIRGDPASNSLPTLRYCHVGTGVSKSDREYVVDSCSNLAVGWQIESIPVLVTMTRWLGLGHFTTQGPVRYNATAENWVTASFCGAFH